MRAAFRGAWPCCAAGVFLLGGCEWGGRAYWLSKYDHEIRASTRAIEIARTDAQRAQAHAARARGYSEKSRYSRSFKLVPAEEYNRLFDLALKDHDQAVALAPGDAQIYLSRGLTFYDRAALENQQDPRTKALFDAAKADFTKTIEKDCRNEQAFDMRGLVYTAIGDHDQAIRDFAEVMKINPRLGKVRLSEAYCERGASYQQKKMYDPAIADYEEAIELGVPSDGCDCQPDGALAWLYLEKRQYDRSWAVVHRAQSAKRWIAPEILAQLKNASGHDQ